MPATKNTIIASGAEFLCPDKVGSTIQWRVRKCSRGGYLCEIILRDCEHRIEFGGWGPGGPEHMKEKIKVLLKHLTNMQTVLNKLPKKRVRRASTT